MISALLLPASVNDHAAFLHSDMHAMTPIGDAASVTRDLNAALGRRTVEGRIDPVSGIFVPQGVASITLVADTAGHVRSISAVNADRAVVESLVELGLHVFADDGAIVGQPDSIRLPPPAPPERGVAGPYPPPPLPAAVSSGAPSPRSITTALVIEAVMTTLTIGLVLLVSTASASVGTPPPPNFLIAMFVLCATMVLRCASMLFVRRGYAWARWVYVSVAGAGFVAAVAFPPLHLVFLHLAAAIVSTILIFIRPASEWLASPAAAGRAPQR